MDRSKWGLLYLIAAICGCAVSQPLTQRGTLILKPQIAEGRLSNTVIPIYTREDIQHIKIHLYTVNGEVEQDAGMERTLTNMQIDNPIVFSNLTEQTHFRVKAYAYSSTDDSALISTNDASCSTDILLEDDDRPVVAPLRLCLINKLFGAEFLDSVAIYHRFLPAGSESIQVN